MFFVDAWISVFHHLSFNNLVFLETVSRNFHHLVRNVNWKCRLDINVYINTEIYGYKIDNIQFSHCDINEFVSTNLQKMNIKIMILKKCLVTKTDFSMLKNIKSFRMLEMTDVDGTKLSELHDCEHITLYESKVSNYEFLNLPKLSYITLVSDVISDTDVDIIINFCRIQTFALDSCKLISDHGLEKLSSSSLLQQIYIYHCDKITSDGITNIINKDTLQILSFSGVINDDFCKKLPNIKYLTSLNLASSTIGNIDIKYISKCKLLKKLYLGDSSANNDGIKYLKKLNLKKLTLLSMPNIDDNALQYISHIKNLSLC